MRLSAISISPFLTLDRYAEGIMKILYADMDDKTAVEFVEKKKKLLRIAPAFF